MRAQELVEEEVVERVGVLIGGDVEDHLFPQGTLAEASDPAKYLVIAVAGVTGFLAIVSQYAAIREAQALVVDLAAIKDSSRLAQQVSASSSFLQLTAVAVVGLGLVIFALVTWSVLG